MNLSFRRAEPQDAEAVAALVNSAYRGEGSRAGWTTEEAFLGGQRIDADGVREILADPKQTLLLCFRDGRLLGNVQLAHENGRGYLGLLTVDPTLQAQGIGRALLSEAEDFVRSEWGVKKMTMTVISLREELMTYYERRGYRRTGETRPFPMDDPRAGLPKRRDFHLVVLEKNL